MLGAKHPPNVVRLHAYSARPESPFVKSSSGVDAVTYRTGHNHDHKCIEFMAPHSGPTNNFNIEVLPLNFDARMLHTAFLTISTQKTPAEAYRFDFSACLTVTGVWFDNGKATWIKTWFLFDKWTTWQFFIQRMALWFVAGGFFQGLCMHQLVLHPVDWSIGAKLSILE